MKQALLFLFVFSNLAWAGREGMPNMPLIQPKKTFEVPTPQAGEELLEKRGFGAKEGEVRMMNLMMVQGSGYEGMDMTHGIPPESESPSPAEGQTATYDVQATIAPNPPRVGSNTLEIAVQTKNTHKPATGLKLRARVYMTSMNMGVEEPEVREISPGIYRTQVSFSMRGPWAVKLILPEKGEKVLNFDVRGD